MLHRVVAVLLALAQGPTPAERNANLEAFDKVWTTVRDKHWDPKLTGLDWQAIRDELRPRMASVTSAAEGRAILNDMVGRLHETHLGIFPGSVYQDLETSSGGHANPGIDLRVLEGHAIVTELDNGSSAAAKGVKPGWEILRIGGAEVRPAVARIGEQFKDATVLDLLLRRSVASRLEGAGGSSVAVEFLDGADRKVSLELDRAAPRGTLARLGNMPPMYVWSEWRRLPEDIGYVRFNAFFDPEALAKTMEDAIKGCGDCRGFVVDVRGNPGGLGALAMGVAGWFTSEAGLHLGTEYLRGLTLRLVIFPRPDPFRGPLAVLVDGCSASTSEILAGGLKDIKRARLFGTRTAAAALPSVIERLPNGDGFQYPIANYISQGGQPLEGIGAIPDEEVRVTRRQLLEGKDPALEAAVQWIRQQKP